jgi:hypothetical protein
MPSGARALILRTDGLEDVEVLSPHGLQDQHVTVTLVGFERPAGGRDDGHGPPPRWNLGCTRCSARARRLSGRRERHL